MSRSSPQEDVMIDLFIRNAKAVDGTSVSEENLCVDKGKIVGKVSRSVQIEARTTIDAEGRFVVPGAVDSHCHIGQLPGTGHYRPQATKAENFQNRDGLLAVWRNDDSA